jgi:hypothetical protein
MPIIPKRAKLSNTKYWNSADSAVFLLKDNAVHETAIDVVTFEYSIAQQKLPIYGYKSVTWDAVMKGNRLVQGTFSVPVIDSIDSFYNLFVDESVYLDDSALLELPEPSLKVKPMSEGIEDFGGLIKKHIDVYLGLTKKEISLNSDNLYYPENKSKIIKIEWMIINSLQQSIAPTGDQVLEFYSFLAKSIYK